MKKNNKKTTNNNQLKLTKKLVLFVMPIILFLLIALIIPKENIIKTTARKLFSGNTPVSQVEITTEDYDNEGSIKVTKEAHWVSKTEAELDLKLETIRKTGDNKKDIVLVFDVSGSMEGEKLDKVKEDASELIEYVLDKDEDNKVGLITFASESRIISLLSNNKEELLETINSISTEDSTNYYLAYKSIEEILSDYNKEAGKDLVVLFMTDGSPTENAGATKGVYDSLKEQHPYMTLNAVEYEKGKTVSDTQDISDGQWIANMDTLNNVLFEATVSPEAYEKLSVIDYIDDEYFEIETNTPTKGSITVDNNKITWRFANNSYITGTEETLKIRLKLKDEYKDIKGLYQTNKKTEIEYKINTEKETTSTLTPVLKNNYDVIYDINAPETCNLEEIEGENHFIYDIVTIKNIEPKCTGYQLKGWQIEERDVKYKSEDKFIMPEEDVHIRAIWSRQTMKAYMDGTVHEKTTLYKEIASQAEKYDYLKEYTGEHQDSLNVSGDQKIYYYYANSNDTNPVALERNNVIFGGFCWQIVRTTDTGGIKMIYNGLPSENGKCGSIDDTQNIGKSTYGAGSSSPAYIGYMNNTIVSHRGFTLIPFYTVLKTVNLNKTHYFSSEYEYNQSVTNRYKLYDSPETEEDERFTSEQCVNENNCNNVLTGTYYLASTNPDYSSTTIRYVVGVLGEKVYYLEIKNGQKLSDIVVNYYIGDNYIEQNDGKYLIEGNVSQTTNINWINQYQNNNKRFFCLNENPCDNPMFFTSSRSDGYYYETITNNYMYGNDFDYVLNEETNEYEYVLKDTSKANIMTFWDWLSNYKKVNYNHYTCGNTIGRCKELMYIFYVYENYFQYMPLSNGDNIKDLLTKLLSEENVNKNNSTIKTKIETWYKDNLNDYTKYLEDIIWCNRRTPSSLGAWEPNGGSVQSLINFSSTSLVCSNITDKFSVSNEKAKLKYPIGVLSYGDLSLSNNNIIRKTGVQYWTMTPATHWQWAHSNMLTVEATGNVTSYGPTSNNYGIRPAISLKPEIEYISGDGSKNNPYIIDTSETDNESSEVEP